MICVMMYATYIFYIYLVVYKNLALLKINNHEYMLCGYQDNSFFILHSFPPTCNITFIPLFVSWSNHIQNFTNTCASCNQWYLITFHYLLIHRNINCKCLTVLTFGRFINIHISTSNIIHNIVSNYINEFAAKWYIVNVYDLTRHK